MPLIYEDRNVEAHIYYNETPQVHCFDRRLGFLEIEVIIDLLLRLPVSYGENPTDFPTPEFVIEALQSVLNHLPKLWTAWEQIRDELPGEL